MANQKYKDIKLIIIFTLISTLLIWIPFFAGFFQFSGITIPPGGMKNIIANYDGPLYIIVAKTWYREKLIKNFSLLIPAYYFPAHFPGYPFLIHLLGQALPYTQAMLLATVLTSVIAALVFYFFLTKFKISSDPFWLTIVFLFIPARHFIVRSVGAPESLFITSILASFYFFRQKNYWKAAIFGSLAQLTKSPGVLLIVSFVIYLSYGIVHSTEPFRQAIKYLKKCYPLLLIPLSLLALFGFYLHQTGDFWAYFNSGDNIHLTNFPFQVFNRSQSWVNTIWLEDLIWLYLIEAVGILLLFKRQLIDLGIFALVFFMATIFVAHRDVSRYSLPLWPFILIGYEPFLQKKEFKIAFLFILPAIYLYALNFVSVNYAPITDWTPFL